MSSPILVVQPEAMVEIAAKMMAENRVRRLAVVDRKRVVGLITVGMLQRP
ncbi:MAG: CBS domain-containing protein [Nitrososphaerota archaeon]